MSINIWIKGVQELDLCFHPRLEPTEQCIETWTKYGNPRGTGFIQMNMQQLDNCIHNESPHKLSTLAVTAAVVRQVVDSGIDDVYAELEIPLHLQQGQPVDTIPMPVSFFQWGSFLDKQVIMSERRKEELGKHLNDCMLNGQLTISEFDAIHRRLDAF